MQSVVSSHPQEGKEVSNYFGRDPTPIVQSYAAANVDLPFLSHTIKYFRYADAVDAKTMRNLLMRWTWIKIGQNYSKI